MKKTALALLAVSGLVVLTVGGAYFYWKSHHTTSLPVAAYYAYDRSFPLRDSVRVEEETPQETIYYVTYYSVHNSRVTGLLAVPKNVSQPLPAVISVHGIKDNKRTDYMENAHRFMVEGGLAVLRIDIANHGDRQILPHKYDLVKGYRYWTREIMTQTVFDIRRAVDFLSARPEIDSTRIGYFGISFGGFIGTVACAVEPRIRVPVIALAGGGVSVLYLEKALSEETRDYLSVIDPINFVRMLSPRPLLMINAEHDEIVPPLMSRAMYDAAGDPKQIMWYATKHREIPQDEVFPSVVEWFHRYL